MSCVQIAGTTVATTDATRPRVLRWKSSLSSEYCACSNVDLHWAKVPAYTSDDETTLSWPFVRRFVSCRVVNTPAADGHIHRTTAAVVITRLRYGSPH